MWTGTPEEVSDNRPLLVPGERCRRILFWVGMGVQPDAEQMPGLGGSGEWGFGWAQAGSFRKA